MDYIQFTNAEQVNTDCKIISCNFWGTDRCSIHNGGHCENCDVFTHMLAQLYMFENEFKKTVKEEVEQYTAN